VIYASFNKLTIATDKAGQAEAESYVDFVLASIKKRPLFNILRLEPLKSWASLLFLDATNYGGLLHGERCDGGHF
jgi:hypothetical protein